MILSDISVLEGWSITQLKLDGEIDRAETVKGGGGIISRNLHLVNGSPNNQNYFTHLRPLTLKPLFIILG